MTHGVEIAGEREAEGSPKGGAKPETKEAIVSDIAETLGVDADVTLSGLEKATKNCLLFIRKTLEVAASAAEEG